MVLLFGVAVGCNVYVTSGSQEKIDRAVALGAKGGVNYKDGDWEKKVTNMLPDNRKWVDAIVDGAGGEIVKRGVRILKVSLCLFRYSLFLIIFHSLHFSFPPLEVPKQSNPQNRTAA